MRADMGRWRALANAVFALAVLALGGFGIYQVAGKQWKVQPTFHVRARFETIGGLQAGHRVRFQGIDVGVVEQIIMPAQPGDRVELVLRVDERIKPLIRSDAIARVMSEGLVGAKMVDLAPGRPDAPLLADSDTIGSERPIEINDLLAKAAASLTRLEAATRAAEAGVGEISAIAASIRRGEGTLGKLVNDDSVYQHMLELSHRGERSLTSLDENLTALKQTWPISRYFDQRAYLDRERVLYQPGAARNSRVLRAEDLFEPGRAILTPVGQSRLDEVGRWCRTASRSTSEVVIAAFTDDSRDEDLAEILTQDQADSVRRYLVNKHAIQSAGWFRSRKIAAVGFGSHTPRTLDASSTSLTARRVEIIVFTPQT